MDINNIRIAGQTALSIYNTMPGKIVLLVVALLFCFAGYKLLPGVCALVGVVLGVACGTCITSLFSPSMTEIMNLIFTVLAMVVLGIVCGIICFKFYHIAVFLVFGAIGAGVVYLPGLFVAEHSQTAFWILLAVCAVLFGTASVLFLRPVSIVATSFFGFAAAFPLLELLNQAGSMRTAVLGCVLTGLGLIFQLLTNRKPTSMRRQRTGKLEEEAAADGQEQMESQDSVSDITQVIDIHAVPEEEPDEIDTISDLVAAHIGMEQHAEQDMDLTQPVGQSTEMLTQPLGHLAEDLQKVSANTDGMQQPEPESNPKTERVQAKKRKKWNPFGILLSLILLAATVFFAVVDIQYAEIVLALALVCCVLKQYGMTVLASAVLCVRRAADCVILFQNGGASIQFVWNIVSCVAFLIITFTALIAYTNARHTAKSDNK